MVLQSPIVTDYHATMLCASDISSALSPCGASISSTAYMMMDKKMRNVHDDKKAEMFPLISYTSQMWQWTESLSIIIENTRTRVIIESVTKGYSSREKYFFLSCEPRVHYPRKLSATYYYRPTNYHCLRIQDSIRGEILLSFYEARSSHLSITQKP